MTLVQLKHFIALARSGSFVKAAAAVHLTQPALSRSIQALEEELGQLLFDRVGRRIELTAFGAETLQRAQLLVEDANDLKQSGRPSALGDGGRIRLGLSSVRISAIVDAGFSVIVDGVSAPSWTRWGARKRGFKCIADSGRG